MTLLTGATGMLGAHIAFILLQKGHSLKALRRKNSQLQTARNIFRYLGDTDLTLFEKIHWAEGDILDYAALLEHTHNAETVYHAAATVSFAPSHKQSMMTINVEGTANVVNACLQNKVGKLCHISSIAALGSSPSGEKIHENSFRPVSKAYSAYSESKYKSEMEVWRGIHEGLKAVIVNPSVILGVGNWQKGSAAMLTKVYEGLKFYSHGITGFVGAKDVATASVALTQSQQSGKRFVINSQNLSYKTVFEAIATRMNKPLPSVYANAFLTGVAWRASAVLSLLTGREPLITRETARSAHTKRRFDNTLVCQTLGISFQPIEQVLDDIVPVFLQEIQNQ